MIGRLSRSQRATLKAKVADYRAGRALLPFVNANRPLRKAGTLRPRYA